MIAGFIGIFLLMLEEYFFYNRNVLESSGFSAFIACICGAFLFIMTKDIMTYIICTISSTILIILLTCYMMVFQTGYLDNGISIILINIAGINIFPFIYQFLTRSLKRYRTYRTLLIYYIALSYGISLIYLLFFGMQRDVPITVMNIIPFKTISPYLLGTVRANSGVILMNLLGNIVVFIPLGSIAVILFKKRLQVFMSLLLAPIIVEIIQYITQTGYMDIDDFILNFIGGVIGVVVIVLIETLYRRRHGKGIDKLLIMREALS